MCCRHVDVYHIRDSRKRGRIAPALFRPRPQQFASCAQTVVVRAVDGHEPCHVVRLLNLILETNLIHSWANFRMTFCGRATPMSILPGRPVLLTPTVSVRSGSGAGAETRHPSKQRVSRNFGAEQNTGVAWTASSRHAGGDDFRPNPRFETQFRNVSCNHEF